MSNRSARTIDASSRISVSREASVDAKRPGRYPPPVTSARLVVVPKLNSRWIVYPSTFRAAIPVGAATITRLSVSDMK